MRFHGIDLPKEKVAEFCRKWRIRELALFGSVLRDDFGDDSDIDVLVTFPEREVDLVEKAGLRNPFRRHSILNNMEVIYAA